MPTYSPFSRLNAAAEDTAICKMAFERIQTETAGPSRPTRWDHAEDDICFACADCRVDPIPRRVRGNRAATSLARIAVHIVDKLDA